VNKYNILLLGQIGTGKSYSLKTVLDAGLELFIQSVEPGITTTIRQWEKHGVDISKIHYNYIAPATTAWDVLEKNAKYTNQFDMATLQKMTPANKGDYIQFLQVVSSFANFIDQHGEEFGPVDEFGPERALALDGLSGLSRMSRALVVGAKPIMTQPEWGVAQQNLLQLILKLTDDTKCTFILISHAERKTDQITGGTHITISTLGQALAPELLKPWDEVILARRDGDKFLWSTSESDVDLKSRSLKFSDEIEPDFKQFFTKDN